MRLWTIHPKYLDRKGLLALWRESLLAQKVLFNRTKGYKKHPQLERFKQHSSPIGAIGFYLYGIYKESRRRGYSFKKDKISRINKNIKPIKVSQGQISFEIKHLASKLKKRDKESFNIIFKIKKIKLHPLFISTKGSRESWEKHE
ncbi:MAG: pyrimidine dimer DNA glycosylase/endonuclease V [Candidatus Omnitrophota bacterium]